MQIRRDYNQSFFKRVRKRRDWSRPLFFLGILMGGVLLFVLANFEDLQVTAMDFMGVLPTPTPFPSQLATEATALIVEGELAAAAALFEQVIAQRPDDVDYLYEYGRLQIDMGDFERALRVAEQALAAGPRDPRGFALQAEALTLSGNPSAAIPVALSGMSMDASFAPLYSALARAYADTGRLAEAIETGLRATELDPLSADARRAYAYALNLSAFRDDATNQLEQAVALDPNHVPAYFELAYQYLAANRDQEAIDLYNIVLSQQPNNARAMLRLCAAYRKVGQFQRALDYCQDAAAADPQSSAAHYEVGRLRYNAFDFAGALEAFNACYQLDAANLECNYYRGLAYFYLNDCDNAWQILRESLVVARTRTDTADAVTDIRAGLVAVEQTCPQYSGQSGALLGPEPTADPAGGGS
ncbi:MAG: tetratricopeptide repeat protein [bacterium]|nr:tetratricopeptide repeat protein [bacterium]